MPEALEIVPLDPADIEVVGPLWKQLIDHVAALPDALVPIRPSEESWPLERRLMLEALGEALRARGAARTAGRRLRLRLRRGRRPGVVHGRQARRARAPVRGRGRARRRHRRGAPGRGGRRAAAPRRRRRARSAWTPATTSPRASTSAAATAPTSSIFYGSPGGKAVGLPGPRRGGQEGRARPLRAARPGRPRRPARPARSMSRRAPRYVSVIGASRATPELAAKAEELGELLAAARRRRRLRRARRRDGGRRARREAKGGVSIGILPEADRRRAAPDLTYSVCSAHRPRPQPQRRGQRRRRHRPRRRLGHAQRDRPGAQHRPAGRPARHLAGRAARAAASSTGCGGRRRPPRPSSSPAARSRAAGGRSGNVNHPAPPAKPVDGGRSPAIVRRPTASTGHPQGVPMTQRGVNLAFVAAKLCRPHVGRVPIRPQTRHGLRAAVTRRLALICAPAGYGKTTTAADLVDRLRLKAVWYKLDVLDHDPVVFIVSLTHALQQRNPDFGELLLERVRSSAGGAVRARRHDGDVRRRVHRQDRQGRAHRPRRLPGGG